MMLGQGLYNFGLELTSQKVTFNNFADAGSQHKGRRTSVEALQLKNYNDEICFFSLSTTPKLHSYQSLLLQINYFSPLRKDINRTKINVMLFWISSF